MRIEEANILSGYPPFSEDLRDAELGKVVFGGIVTDFIDQISGPPGCRSRRVSFDYTLERAQQVVNSPEVQFNPSGMHCCQRGQRYCFQR